MPIILVFILNNRSAVVNITSNKSDFLKQFILLIVVKITIKVNFELVLITVTLNIITMERFVVHVEKDKAQFFKELIESIEFVEIINIDSIIEPRIYPASGFEIRSKNKGSDKVKGSASGLDITSSLNENNLPSREDQKNLKQIRDAMSAIERKREESRK